MRKNTSISQQDIAEKAGVSVMTVSRALSGKAGVSKALVDRICRMAEDMGYVPNPLVQSLIRTRKQKAHTQTLLLGWYGATTGLRKQDQDGGQYDTFAEYLKGAEQLCARRGFRIEEVPFHEVQIARAEQILIARGIRGLLLGPGETSQNESPAPESSLYIVQIGRSRKNPVHDRIVTDSFRSMLHCLRVLRDIGYLRIGYVDDRTREERNEFRHHGAFLLEHPANTARFRLRSSGEDPDRIFAEFLERVNPDALVIGGNAMRGAVLRHPSPPPFLLLNRNGQPDWISGMDVRHRDMGAEAARRLIDAILGPQPARLKGHSVSLNEVWHQGRSHLRRA